MVRESGYYWIKREGETEWEPAFYIDVLEVWMLIGEGRAYQEAGIIREVGPRLPRP